MKVIVDGLAAEYLDEGQGPLLLLLHGWGTTMRSFDQLVPELSGFRVVRLDMPGFGLSEQPRDAWDVERYIQFVRSFCAKLNLQPVALVGHSFGGRVILKGVATGVLTPQKIVLIAAAGLAKRRSLRTIGIGTLSKLGKILLWPLPSRLYARVRSWIYARSGSDYLTVGGMSDTFLKVVREDLHEYAARITLPTLIVWGAHDVVTPVSQGRAMHQLINGSQYHEFPNSGHFVFQEHAKEIGTLIRRWI
jgi:pimeloyl-ACP methyl ester carboxylesterase